MESHSETLSSSAETVSEEMPREEREPFYTTNEYLQQQPYAPPPHSTFGAYGGIPQQQLIPMNPNYNNALYPNMFGQQGFYNPQQMPGPQMGMPVFYPPYMPPQLPAAGPSEAEMQLAALLKEKEKAEEERRREDKRRREKEEWEEEQKKKEKEKAEAIKIAIEKFRLAEEAKAREQAAFEQAKKDVKKAADDEAAVKAKEKEKEYEKKLEEAKKEAEDAKKAAEEAKGGPDRAKFVKLIDPRHKPERCFKVPWLLAKEWRVSETKSLRWREDTSLTWWQNLEEMLTQAFVGEKEQGVPIVPLIEQGRYNLVRSDGTNIITSYWNDVVEPGWEVKIVLWPVDPPKVVHHKPHHQERRAPKRRQSTKTNRKRTSVLYGEIVDVPPGAPPPPPTNVEAPPRGTPVGIEVVDDDETSELSANMKKKRSNKPPGFWSVMFGGPSRK